MKEAQQETQPITNDKIDKEALLQELENLKPNWKSSAFRVLGVLIVALFVFWKYPDVLHQPIMYIILLLNYLANAEFNSERKRVNKKIEAIHQLLKSNA